MFNLNEQAIQRTLSLISTERATAATKLQELNQQISSLKREVSTTETLEWGLNNSEILLKRALVVLGSWPTEIMKLKEQIVLLEKEVVRGDILVSEQGRLQSEIARIKSEIAEKCQHPFVIGYTGWEGSYSYDYDDGYQGERKCIVCGAYEYSETDIPNGNSSLRREVYKILQENENRLIDDSKLDREKGYDNSQPLEEIISGWIPKRVYELQNASQ